LAYEAVPIDIEIQKLTAAERDALSRYKIHENINTILSNENTPVVIGGLIGGILLKGLLEETLESTDLTEIAKAKVMEASAAINPAAYLWKVAQFGAEGGTEVGLGIRKFFSGDKP
jgi:hypothetical protein